VVSDRIALKDNLLNRCSPLMRIPVRPETQWVMLVTRRRRIEANDLQVGI